MRRIDEEHSHAPSRLATPAAPAAGVARRAGAVRSRPAPPRRGRAHAPRLRRRPRPVRRAGRRAQGLDAARRRLRASLRRYAAALSERRRAPRTTVARKLASLRAFFGSLRRARRVDRQPRRPAAAPPSAPRTCRACCRPPTIGALLDRIPATTPLELRDRALFEIAYACGLRAEELVTLDVGSVDFDAEQRARRGQGRQDPVRARGRARAARGRRATWSAAGRRCSRTAGARARAVPLQVGPAAVDVATCGAGCACGRATRGSRAACTRTRCATRSPPICSRAAPTCARSRSCWATQPSRRPRSTLG